MRVGDNINEAVLWEAEYLCYYLSGVAYRAGAWERVTTYVSWANVLHAVRAS